MPNRDNQRFSINKTTTISLSVMLLLIAGVYSYAKLEAKTDQNSQDIVILTGALTDALKEQTKVDSEQNLINRIKSSAYALHFFNHCTSKDCFLF